MVVVRYGPPGAEKPGLQLGPHLYSAAAVTPDYDEAFFASGRLTRLAAYFAQPTNIVGVGLNYTDHAQATGEALPTEPILLPPGSKQTDWGVELGVGLGRQARYVSEAEALRYVAGYVLLNDLSARAYQVERGGDADKNKGCDSFAPVGPYLVTPDEVAAVHALLLWLRVHGHLMQDGSTRHLLFGVPYLIAYLSRFMTLLPGDLIATGTPTGTGYRQQPPVFLRPGDALTYGIPGLGAACHTCVATVAPG